MNKLFILIIIFLSKLLFAEQVDTLIIKKVAINSMKSLLPERGIYEIEYLKTYFYNNQPTFYLNLKNIKLKKI